MILSRTKLFLQKALFHQIAPDAPRFLLAIAGSLYMLVALFSISSRIFFAEQKGYWGYFYQTIGVIGGFLAAFIVTSIHIHENQLLWIMFAWIAPQFLAATIGFVHAMPLGKWIERANFSLFSNTFKVALQFSFNSLGGAFVLGIDYIIMSQIISSSDIVVYNIFNKIFTFIFFGYSALLSAFWPVMAESYASNDFLKIEAANKSLLRNIFVAFVYISFAVMAIIISKNFIMKYFGSAKLEASVLIICLFGFYYIVRVWVDTYAMAILSRNKVGFLSATVPLQAVVSVIFLYYFGSKFGLAGILGGLILCFLVTAAWMLPCYHYYLLGRFKRSKNVI